MMQHLYFATTFASALIFLLLSIVLFVRRKEGGRARVIFAYIGLFSVFNYFTRFIALCHGNEPALVVSIHLLVHAIFMLITMSVYPIDALFPGWINFKRLLMLYSPWLFLLSLSLITVWAGVKYQDYSSLWDMLPHAGEFNVWFRFVLCLFLLLPALFVVLMLWKKKWNNENFNWLKKYAITLAFANFSYILVLTFENSIIHTLYYYVSIGCKLYIVYLELFVRSINKITETNVSSTAKSFLMDSTVIHYKDFSISPAQRNTKQNNIDLIDRLNAYMKSHCAWRDPDLSLSTLASVLCTNRTSLAKAMRENGYENYTYYINKLRIEDFLQQIESGQLSNLQEIFFEVGFRSRSTALRNFRQYTGMTPSEYLQKKGLSIGENLE